MSGPDARILAEFVAKYNPVPPGTYDLLEAVEWAERHFGSLLTGRTVRVRAMLRAEAAGLVQSAGLVLEYDQWDNPREPERWLTGWKLTDAGRAVLAQWRAAAEGHP